jgi:hypothetical protein
MAEDSDNRVTYSSTDETGRTSGETLRDDGDSYHHTSFVETSDGLSLRASYDEDKSTGESSNAITMPDEDKNAGTVSSSGEDGSGTHTQEPEPSDTSEHD